MTTLIYFFLMSLCLFIVPQLVVKKITNQAKLDKNIVYLVFACLLPLFWMFLPRELLHTREINFLQHAVGGGVAVGFVAIYFLKTLRDHLPFLKNFFVQFVFVFALVSSMGVVNELLEFALDFFKIGIFSSDRYDTWFDIVANTSGAMLIFLLYKIVNRV